MENQQITPEDGCGYVIRIPSGRRWRDAHAFFLRGDWHFLADGGGEQAIPAQLANYVIRRKVEGARIEPAVAMPDDGAVCVVRLPPKHDPTGEHDDMVAIYWRGYWILRGDRCDEQVIAAGQANYTIVRQILSEDSIFAAVRKVDQMARRSPRRTVRKRAA